MFEVIMNFEKLRVFYKTGIKPKKNLHRAMTSANQGRHCAQYIKKGGLVIQKSVICSWIEN